MIQLIVHPMNPKCETFSSVINQMAILQHIEFSDTQYDDTDFKNERHSLCEMDFYVSSRKAGISNFSTCLKHLISTINYLQSSHFTALKVEKH